MLDRTNPDAMVLIVGGGPTGVEMAGALAELRNSWAAAGILSAGQVRITLLERGPDLLPQKPSAVAVLRER